MTRVLLVDDQALVRAGFRSLLEKLPSVEAVVEADDGREAMDLLRKSAPDIILMDIAMPGVDGLEGARRIREDENLRHTPVVALTAYDTGGFQRAAADAGFDAYLTKPINFDRLHELIRRLLKE